MNLYLIRHGESLGNVNKQAYYDMPEWQIPLTEKGREQAKEVGLKLSHIVNPIIITSPYVRAKDTADIIGGYFSTSLSYQETPLIREREWGNLREEVEQYENREDRKHLFDFYRRPINGESFADVYQRAFIFYNYLLDREHRRDTIYYTTSNYVIVSHGEFLKVLLMIIDSKTVEEFDKMPNIKNCEIIHRQIYV